MDDRGSGFSGGDHCGRGRPAVGVETRRRVSPTTSGRLGSDGAPEMRRRSPRFRSSLVVLPTLLGWLLHFCFLRRPVRSGRLDSGAAPTLLLPPPLLGSAWPYRAAPQRLSSSCCSDVAVDLQSATRKLATDYSNKNVVGVTSGNFENDSLKTKRLIHLLGSLHDSCLAQNSPLSSWAYETRGGHRLHLVSLPLPSIPHPSSRLPSSLPPSPAAARARLFALSAPSLLVPIGVGEGGRSRSCLRSGRRC